MKEHLPLLLTTLVVGVVAANALVLFSHAADAKDQDAIKEVMKTYHKAPKGTDPICKKAQDGKATPEEIKNLVASYRVLTTAKPPRGDAASWKDKTSKLLAAAEAMQQGQTDGLAKYKEAVNCKACHSIHKPPVQ